MQPVIPRRRLTLLVLSGAIAFGGCVETVGGGRQLDVKERTSNNVFDAGPRPDGNVVVPRDAGPTPVRDGGTKEPDRDGGATFEPLPNATVGSRCSTGATSNWLVLSAAPAECSVHGDVLANGSAGTTVAFAELPAGLTAPTTTTIPATVCLGPTCEQRQLELVVATFAEGTGMTGSWSIVLDDAIATGSLNASWCNYDDLRPGGASTLAGGLDISEVAFYQSVKISVMRDGNLVNPVNAPIVQNREALARVFVSRGASWQNREVVARMTFEHPAFATPRIYEERVTVSADSSETVGASTFNFEIPEETLLDGVEYSIGLYETEACVPENGNTTGALFPATGTQELPVVSNGSTFNVVLVPVRYNADGSGRLPDTSPQQVQRYYDLMYAMFPVADLNLTVGNVLEWNNGVAPNGSGWSNLLDAVLQHRNQESPPANTYYYGIFEPAASFGAYCSGGCVAGLGPLPSPGNTASRGAIGLGFGGDRSPDTFVHEIGHALGRPHAPCGVQQADGNYPYPNARLGVWGFNLLTSTLIDPDDTRDMMSYCDPIWVSDYTYREMFERIQFANQGFPFTSFPPTEFWVVLDDMDGVRWGSTMIIEEPPSGTTAKVDYLDANGTPIATDDAFVTPLDHVDGRYILMPKPPEGAVYVDVEGTGRLPVQR